MADWLKPATGIIPMPALRFQKEVGKTADDKNPRLVRDRTGLDKGLPTVEQERPQIQPDP